MPRDAKKTLTGNNTWLRQSLGCHECHASVYHVITWLCTKDVGWLDVTICITGVLQLTDDFYLLTQHGDGDSPLLNPSIRSLYMED